MRFLCLVLALCGSMSPLLAKESFQQGEESFSSALARYGRRSVSGFLSKIKRYESFSTQKTYDNPSEHDKPSEAPRLRKKPTTEARSSFQSMGERLRRSSFRLSSFSFKKKRTPSQSSEDSDDSSRGSLTSIDKLSPSPNYSDMSCATSMAEDVGSLVSSSRNRDYDDSEDKASPGRPSSSLIPSIKRPLPFTLSLYQNTGRLRAQAIRRVLNQEREELLQALAEQPNQEPPQVFSSGNGTFVTRSGQLCTQDGEVLEGLLFYNVLQKTWDSPEAYNLWAQEQKEQKHCPHDETDHHALPSALSTTKLQSEAKSVLLEEDGYLVPSALDLKSVAHTIEAEDGYLAPNVSSPQRHVPNLEAQDYPHLPKTSSDESPNASLQRLRDELLDLMKCLN